MQADTEVYCQDQEPRHRRGPSPDDGDLEQDIFDISMWLVQRYQDPFVQLWVNKHHFQCAHQIASVAVVIGQSDFDHMTAAAQAAFATLDYDIHDAGADVFAFQYCGEMASKHEVFRGYTRIETAFRRKKVLLPCIIVSKGNAGGFPANSMKPKH